MNDKDFGKILSSYRRKKNLTQKGLADILHVSDKAVSRWETNFSLPDVDMICKISKVLDIPLSTLLQFKINDKDITDLEVLASELESKNKRYHQKAKKICLVFLIIILFSLLLQYFAVTYNNFKVFNVSVIGNGIYSSYGVYIKTKDRDVIYLGHLGVLNDIDKELSTVEMYIKKNKKEYLIYSSTLNKNIEVDISKSQYKIEKLENYLDSIFIKVDAVTKKGKEINYTAKLKINKRTSNNKLIYEPLNDEKSILNTNIKSKKEIINALFEMGFKEETNNIYVNEKEHLKYYINGSRFEYEYGNNGIESKYSYSLKSNLLEVLIINNSHNLNNVISEYKYNDKIRKVECIVGKCDNYKDILKKINPYIKKLT